jgi:hypothetical protein
MRSGITTRYGALSIDAQAMEMRNMIGNVAHDLKTVSDFEIISIYSSVPALIRIFSCFSPLLHLSLEWIISSLLSMIVNEI